MKRITKKFLALTLSACMLSALLTACGSSAPASTDGASTDSANPDKVYELSFTIHDPATSAKVAYYEDLAAQTLEATNGGVKITVYPGGTLVAATDVAEGVLTGAADMGWLYTAFFPGQFPLTEAISLPMILQDSIQGTKVFQGMYAQNTDLQEELSAYKVLGLYCNPMAYIYTTEPVNTMADLKGLTLRCPAGVATDMITAWGGTPILMGPGDVYQSIEKGVINGFTFEWTGTGSFNLSEVIDYVTEVPIYVGEFITAMNWDSYNALPADYQAAIDEIWCDNQTSLDLAQIFMDDAAVARTKATDELGVTIIEPTPEATAEFKAVADDYVTKWITDHTTSTFDAQAYYDSMIELANQNAS